MRLGLSSALVVLIAGCTPPIHVKRLDPHYVEREFESAHITEAVSEVVVRAGHSVQDHPDTVNEVRRILLLHLAESCPAGRLRADLPPEGDRSGPRIPETADAPSRPDEAPR